MTWSRSALLQPPIYVVNGVAVSVGVALVLGLGHLIDPDVALLMSSGATACSLADTPGTPRRVGRAVLGALWMSAFSTAVGLFVPLGWPMALGIGLVAFVAAMSQVWGQRAGPMSFAPVLALIFALGHPRGEMAPLAQLGWSVFGMLLYLGWAMSCARVLQPVFRQRALEQAVAATAALLRSRARVLERGAQDQALSDLIGVEAQLAARLQGARDLLFPDVHSPVGRRQAAVLLRLIDLRDTLMASRLDLDLLGNDEAGRWLRECLAMTLRELAYGLVDEEPAGVLLRGESILAHVMSQHPLAPEDHRRPLLDPLTERLRLLVEDVRRIRLLRHGAEVLLPLSPHELQLFVAPEGWPLRALLRHRRMSSPVLRHAVRSALALGVAYLIGLALPWHAHPHWVVLSVAVVLRGNLEQTLSRRNARVLGTVLGCFLVLGLAHVHAVWVYSVVFLFAVAIAHAFVMVRYWVTATAATVMALLQAQLAHGGGFAVGERLLDTVLGAVLALAFSYVLPSWERRSVPNAIQRVLQALYEYAGHALTLGGEVSTAQRLARRNAYDALALLAAAVQRSRVEPSRVQLPVQTLSHLLDHAQQTMAHLSSLRSLLARRGAELQRPEAHQALAETLGGLREALLQGRWPDDADGELTLNALPTRAPADDPVPWLLRRLRATLRDARRVAREAAKARETLDRG